jgi:GAF domain-containing protein
MTDTRDSEQSTRPAESVGSETDPTSVSDALLGLDAGAWSALERIGRSLHVKEADLTGTLEAVLSSATGLIGNTGAAGLNLYVRGRFEPQVVLGEAPHRLDALQQRTGEGPCVDASRDQAVVQIADMRREQRWTLFAETAVALDVLSMLCVPLWIDDVRLGSLSLYSPQPDGYHEHELKIASLFATHAALAIADAQRTTNLQRALVNRDVIGQAKGVLMERYRITANEAFDLLARASQSGNRKLAEVAEMVSTTGALPGEL